MKKGILIMLASIITFAGCGKRPAEVNDKYHVDSFYDVEVLRYYADGFDTLSLQQKKLVYYLSRAALCGRDILYDQNCAYNLMIRRSMAYLYENYRGDRTDPNFQAVERYLKRVWFSNGIHHHYSGDKFFPGFEDQWLVQAFYDCGFVYDSDLFTVMYDDSVFNPHTCTDPTRDIVKYSGSNYYFKVTQKEAEKYYASHEDHSKQPKSIGLNARMVKTPAGKIEEQVYKVGGLYTQAIEKIVYWLQKAQTVACNDQQVLVLQKLIEFYQTGDLNKFNEYCIAWVQDTASPIDFVNGFTETYGDPLGRTGAWEGFVNIKDEQATKRTELIANNAQWFEDNSPTDKQFKKESVKGVSAKVVKALCLSGDCYPSTPIGINLPNASWIRKEYGSKSVTIDNLTDAYNAVGATSGLAEEFMLPDIIAPYKKCGDRCSSLHTDLHECVGHGSGKLLPGVSKESLKEYSSTIEEARADLFGLYFMADPKMVELGLLETPTDYECYYYQQMMNGLLTQLCRIVPGKNLEESHMRNRQLIALWCLEHATNHEVEVIEQDSNYFVKINDYAGLRNLYGQLLKEIQRITSEGDYAAAKTMVETYGVKINPDWHANILKRYATLDIKPYKGFVNPRYTAVRDSEGQIIDVKVDYTEGYTEQHLRYDKEFSFLPTNKW